jgi:predicted metal-binding membrane protein
MWPRVTDRRLTWALLTALIALTWLSLWLWGRSPYGRFLGHEELGHAHGVGDQYALLVLLFVAGWMLMTVAMMLPTSLPLVALFSSFVRKSAHRGRLVALLVVGYLSVWTVFGLAVHLGDRLVHESVDRSAWLEANAWGIGAATVLFAGLYQFAPLKYRCLERCRSPLSFIMGHWQGGRGERQAFRLGVHHGLFCLGCCWSLMLLMFAVGVGNLGWMLALSAVMAVEKNMPIGRHLSAPLGVLLVGWGLVLVATRASIGGGFS